MDTDQNENDVPLSYGNNAALNILMINENGLAEIIDFSERGATCQVFTSDAARAFESTGVDLFNCLAGKHLKNLPCKVRYVTRRKVNSLDGKHKQIYQIEFPNLTDDRIKELNEFIEDGYQYFVDLHSNTH